MARIGRKYEAVMEDLERRMYSLGRMENELHEQYGKALEFADMLSNDSAVYEMTEHEIKLIMSMHESVEKLRELTAKKISLLEMMSTPVIYGPPSAFQKKDPSQE